MYSGEGSTCSATTSGGHSSFVCNKIQPLILFCTMLETCKEWASCKWEVRLALKKPGHGCKGMTVGGCLREEILLIKTFPAAGMWRRKIKVAWEIIIDLFFLSQGGTKEMKQNQSKRPKSSCLFPSPCWAWVAPAQALGSALRLSSSLAWNPTSAFHEEVRRPFWLHLPNQRECRWPKGNLCVSVQGVLLTAKQSCNYS